MASANVNPGNMLTVTMTAQWSLVNYVKTFSYTGSAQTWTVPYTGKYKIELWGAQGGYCKTCTYTSFGGKGGYTSGITTISKSTNLYLYIGGSGETSNGWNGGGAITNNSYPNSYGGGATDIRTVSGTWNNTAGLRSRVMVAGGGGGGAEWTSNGGGAGGGLIGEDGYTPGTNCNQYQKPLKTPAKGGNQTAGGAGLTCDGTCMHTQSYSGSFGVGAQDATSISGYYSSGGGGSGWYGGGSGATTNCHIMGSAGGSSYISGHTGSVAVTSASSSSPKSGCTTGTTNNSCSLTPYINPATNASYTFTNTLMIDGAGYKWTNTKGSLQAMPNPSGGNYASGVGHSGNGYARITYLGT